MTGHQSRADSVMEALTNIVVGIGIGQATNLVVIPMVMGVPISAAENLALSGCYTVVSLVRQYVLRRAFNGRSVWQAVKGAWA